MMKRLNMKKVKNFVYVISRLTPKSKANITKTT